VKISYYPSCTDIYFPTGFTPNGDGKNDRFGPIGNLATIKTFTLKVFDRWGQMVFNSNSPSNSWSGTSVNNNLNTTAVFVWYAEYTLVNGTVYKKKGLVTKIL
jgi:gliding motility-associated-like protein